MPRFNCSCSKLLKESFKKIIYTFYVSVHNVYLLCVCLPSLKKKMQLPVSILTLKNLEVITPHK